MACLGFASAACLTPPRAANSTSRTGEATESVCSGELDAGLTLPKRLHPVIPPYPPRLRALGFEGDVTVLAHIDETGRVQSVKVVVPSSHAAFDEVARAAALADRFEPAKRDGVPIPFTLSYTYRFRIDGR